MSLLLAKRGSQVSYIFLVRAKFTEPARNRKHSIARAFAAMRASRVAAAASRHVVPGGGGAVERAGVRVGVRSAFNRCSFQPLQPSAIVSLQPSVPQAARIALRHLGLQLVLEILVDQDQHADGGAQVAARHFDGFIGRRVEAIQFRWGDLAQVKPTWRWSGVRGVDQMFLFCSHGVKRSLELFIPGGRLDFGSGLIRQGKEREGPMPVSDMKSSRNPVNSQRRMKHPVALEPYSLNLTGVT